MAPERSDVIVVGSGNAAMCAAIAAQASGAQVLVIEKADESLAGGNSKYTAGAMRFAYQGKDDLIPLLKNPHDPRIETAEFGSYTALDFERDLLRFNDGRPISPEQRDLIDLSYESVLWLAKMGVKFEPIFERQSFVKDGKHVFWGGLTLAAEQEGVGLVASELAAFETLGGKIRYETEALDLACEEGKIIGVKVRTKDGENLVLNAKAIILACGGFEANAEMRRKFIGEIWGTAKVRGTPHNLGQGLEMAFKCGAHQHGFYGGCHATPMDLHMKDFGNLEIPPVERKNYRKICYFLGIMVNGDGVRFVDEGKDFRNYTYAQFGKSVLEQPGQFAWQIFDSKVEHLLYQEYRFHDAHFVEADTLVGLLRELDGIEDKQVVLDTITIYNDAVDDSVAFDPTLKDGKATSGIELPKSNWAQKIDTPPFKAYPVTGGITFTYGGVEVNQTGQVMRADGSAIEGLFACGEMVGGVFFNGYPGGSGLTSGAIFGHRAGLGAAATLA